MIEDVEELWRKARNYATDLGAVPDLQDLRNGNKEGQRYHTSSSKKNKAGYRTRMQCMPQ